MPLLRIINDRRGDFKEIKANIFTIGQGICLQRLTVTNSETFKFDHSLSYGSWYDIQIIAYPDGHSEPLKYLRKGIYLSYGKRIRMTELTDEDHRDYGVEWKCSNCKQANIGSVAICEHCHTNKSQTIITIFSYIPIIGIPFSIANATLRCGTAAQSNKTSDKIDASITTIFAAVDVITAPFIVGVLVKIPAKVSAETGIKLTAKTVFYEAGKPLLKEFGKELGKDGIVELVKAVKEPIQTVVSKIYEKND